MIDIKGDVTDITEESADKILGIDRRSLPTAIYGRIDMTIILVAGQVGDYAAYRGCGSDQFVIDHGDKLTFAEAEGHFFGLKKERYRS